MPSIRKTEEISPWRTVKILAIALPLIIVPFVILMIVAAVGEHRPERPRVAEIMGKIEFPDPGDMPPPDPNDHAGDLIEGINRGLGIVDPRIKAELRQTLGEIGNAIRRQDQLAIARRISGTPSSRGDPFFANLTPQDVREFDVAARGLERGMAQSFVNDVNGWHWTNLDVKKITQPDRNTALVLTRFKAPAGTKVVTWRLARRADGWRVYDYEQYWSVRGVIRHSGILETMRLTVPRPDTFATIKSLREASSTLDSAPNALAAERARRILDDLPIERVPEPLLAGYRSMRAQALMRTNQLDKALEENGKIRELEPNRPANDMVDAMLLNDLKRSEEALTRIERFHRLVGETSESNRELGLALSAQGRRPEARRSPQVARRFSG